jgi:hypothetical protein
MTGLSKAWLTILVATVWACVVLVAASPGADVVLQLGHAGMRATVSPPWSDRGVAILTQRGDIVIAIAQCP